MVKPAHEVSGTRRPWAPPASAACPSRCCPGRACVAQRTERPALAGAACAAQRQCFWASRPTESAHMVACFSQHELCLARWKEMQPTCFVQVKALHVVPLCSKLAAARLAGEPHLRFGAPGLAPACMIMVLCSWPATIKHPKHEPQHGCHAARLDARDVRCLVACRA